MHTPQNKLLPCGNSLKRPRQHFHTLPSGTASGNETNITPCAPWTSFFLQQANKDYFLNKHRTDKSATEQDHKAKKRNRNTDENKSLGRRIWTLSSFFPVEFTQGHCLWLVLQSGGSARCWANRTPIASLETESGTSCIWEDLGKYPEGRKRNKEMMGADIYKLKLPHQG